MEEVILGPLGQELTSEEVSRYIDLAFYSTPNAKDVIRLLVNKGVRPKVGEWSTSMIMSLFLEKDRTLGSSLEGYIRRMDMSALSPKDSLKVLRLAFKIQPDIYNACSLLEDFDLRPWDGSYWLPSNIQRCITFGGYRTKQ